MHSCVTQDKWEIKIERRDAAAASILLYSSAAASISLNRLTGELYLFLCVCETDEYVICHSSPLSLPIVFYVRSHFI